ncbi:MAG: MATE family efflux transporter [Bacteroidetes bacterium]|nr:MATE family efflux transporter [Bacteroidota bacterium]MBT6687136.1 MATE family efflux transporter [Bacteroidota bacterium]MBT7144909.1 MATE family efflux transporter [Bacteroidota bacterium]MBT7492172.1 MATE family efflux transporter [Bacteroidota bacterium]
MVLEMIMESIFAVVDIKFVSELGADAVATVGITESLITIIYAISVGLSMATTALVSRRIGEKKNRDASIAAFQAILLGILFSSIIAIPGVIFSKQILELMGASTEIVENMSGYATIMLGGNGIIMLLFIINAIFRSSGDAAISMRVLWLANILNLILDPLLIFGIGPFPELGVKGAAIATNIGRGTAVIFQFYLLFSGKHRIKLDLSILKIDFKVIRKLIKISYGGIFQYLIATSSWIGLVRIISIFGSEIVAGYTIAIRIIIFSLLPSWGISNAAATLVGQNLGANKPDRAEKSVWITGKINMIIMGIMGIIFVIFPDFFVKLFIDDPVVVSSGSSCLRIVSFGFIAYGLGMVLANAFNGAGDTITPTKINFISFWIIEIPIAYILSLPFGMREEGVFLSIIIAEIVMTILAAYLFKQGKWKLKIV